MVREPSAVLTRHPWGAAGKTRRARLRWLCGREWPGPLGGCATGAGPPAVSSHGTAKWSGGVDDGLPELGRGDVDTHLVHQEEIDIEVSASLREWAREAGEIAAHLVRRSESLRVEARIIPHAIAST